MKNQRNPQRICINTDRGTDSQTNRKSFFSRVQKLKRISLKNEEQPLRKKNEINNQNAIFIK